MSAIIKFKRGLDANLAAQLVNDGEPIFVKDTGKLYVGNGETRTLINPTLGTASTVDVGTEKGQIPVLGDEGKFNPSVLPAIAITETTVVGSTEERLALKAQVGDVAVQTDTSTTYILKAEPATEDKNWVKLLFPTDIPVTSVAGKTGDVTLEIIDIQGLSPALDGKMSTLGGVFAGFVSAPTPMAGESSTKLATTEFVTNAITTVTNNLDVDGGIF